MNAETLKNAIRQGIPLSQHMDFRVQELTSQHIKVFGAAAENQNVHNTAFAGSLYSICTLAAWGLAYSQIPENASLVMASASIDYLRPVNGDIIAETTITPDDLSTFLQQLNKQGKARLMPEVTVKSDKKIAVNFSAHLHVRKGLP